jgi:hypothetical protein
MANTHTTLTGLFSAIADAIRAKTGKTDAIVADNFADEINGILAGGEWIGTAKGHGPTFEGIMGLSAYKNINVQ